MHDILDAYMQHIWLILFTKEADDLKLNTGYDVLTCKLVLWGIGYAFGIFSRCVIFSCGLQFL